MIVTIDGPAASGKSITARLVAQKMGWLYLDTGAMYRAMAVAVLDAGISLDDSDKIGVISKETEVRLEPTEALTKVFVNNEEVTERIRTPEIDKAVGPVCEVPKIREVMVEQQRKIAQGISLIAEGRDMGTVVFPNANLKFFMNASIKARAKRRQLDMKKNGIEISLDSLIDEIKGRDLRDSNRAHSPLKSAKDAVMLDTSVLTIEQQVQFIIDRIYETKPSAV